METKTSTRARVISLVVIALFAAAAVLSAMFMNTVAINYNLADYLGADTQTKIALDIIDEEFGMTGSIQVMVRNVTPDRAEELADEIEALPNVLNVNFDKYDTAYYKEDKLTFDQFVSFADELLQNDADALEFADADTSKTVGMMNTVAQLMADELTADELYDRLTTGAMEGTDVQLSSIRQLYGMYFCQDVPEQAVDFQTMPTVFSSGMILTVCGFVIHFISSQNSISTVGLLLGIGAVCSVVMITVVLPSLLYLLDAFVLKLSIKKKK